MAKRKRGRPPKRSIPQVEQPLTPTDAQLAQRMPSHRRADGSVATVPRYEEGPGPGRIWRNRAQTPLDLYHSRGQINRAQFDAGEKLMDLFLASGQKAAVSSIYFYTGAQGGKAPGMGDGRLAALQQLTRAFRAVSGGVGRALIENVCCYGFALREVDLAARHYPGPTEKMARLREALDELVLHFGLPIPADLRHLYRTPERKP